jgi:anti-anti-sigma factor
MSTSQSPEISKVDGVTVISLGPDYENLDESLLDTLKETVLQAAQTSDPPLVVLDLSHTKFFGSAFIEVLFRLWNRLNAREGGRFAISGLTPYCAEVLEITRLDQLWPIYSNRDEAVSALSKDGG